MNKDKTETLEFKKPRMSQGLIETMFTLMRLTLHYFRILKICMLLRL